MNGQIIFWDIRKPEKVLNAFYKTQTDSIVALAGAQENILFAASEDQSIVQYNLLGTSEDEAVELIMNPGNDCRRLHPISKKYLAYEASDNSVGFYDLDTGVKGREIKYEHGVI